MIQPRTQTRDYWEHEFSLTETDIEQIYNHFLEVERPQLTGDVVRAVMQYRVAEEKNALLRRVSGHKIYQPSGSYDVGDKIVFPVFEFTTGEVTAKRAGYNPQAGEFNVITVQMKGKDRTFSADLLAQHAANLGEGGITSYVEAVDANELYGYYGSLVETKVREAMETHDEFVYLSGTWAVKTMLADISIGHLHLAEAVLDMSGGGPLTTDEILLHLDMDKSIDADTQTFSLNYSLLNDKRFDEVAPKNQVAWFLKNMEPEDVRLAPTRLLYEPIPYDRALLSPQLSLLENEIADEWSDLDTHEFVQTTTLTLSYPHRVVGSLPLNASMRNILSLGRSPRQIFTFRDIKGSEDIKVWAIKEGRYVYGLKDWYEEHKLVVGAYITLKKTDDPNVILIDYDRRKPQSEDVRLATVSDGRIRFELQRRRVGCGYDDLQVVGTDHIAAIDAVHKKVATQQRSLSFLIAALLPELARMSPQNAVHSRTLYSIINMVRRVPPGPVFAELVRHPAFLAIGDLYWRFDPRRWQRD